MNFFDTAETAFDLQLSVPASALRAARTDLIGILVENA